MAGFPQRGRCRSVPSGNPFRLSTRSGRLTERRFLLGQGESPRDSLKILHLKTGEIESIASTERLFSPRWSPDEKQILALEVNTGKLHMYDSVKCEWRPFARQYMAYPKWSRDGKYIYGEGGTDWAIEAIRVEVATGRQELIARTDFKTAGAIGFGPWLGWTEDWEPLTVRDLSSTQVYRIDLDR